MHRLGAIAALSTLGAVALVAARPPFGWTDGDQLALAAAWCIALVASAWLALVSTAALAALRRGRPAVAHAVARVAPFGARRAIEFAILGAAIALPAAPAHAVTRDQPVVRAPAPHTVAPEPTIPQPKTPKPTTPKPTTPPAPPPRPPAAPKTPPKTPPKTAPTADPPPVAASTHHVVRRGENLWAIARAALVARGDPQPAEAAIARYWQRVVETNRHTLRSGNPSLIYPGEIVSLPRQPPS